MRGSESPPRTERAFRELAEIAKISKIAKCLLHPAAHNEPQQTIRVFGVR